jgi:Leucine-rich repeat (LRR) protein
MRTARFTCIVLLFCLFCYPCAGFSDSQAPCFAAWSRSELEKYAWTAWRSSVLLPIELDSEPCPITIMGPTTAARNTEVHGATNLKIAAEAPNEAAQADSETSTYNALMTLYTSTNGPSWLQSWNWGNATLSVCQWYGICCNATADEFLSCPMPNWEKGNFSGTCCTPSGIITSLYLPKNNLQGLIPSELAQLTTLSALYLNDNALVGPIPAAFGQLKALSSLHLGNNQLNGTIPSELGQLLNLAALRMGHNQLTGTIPSILGQLSALQHIDFSSNELKGRIPSELGQLSSLIVLRLNHNDLTGTIPSVLGQLRNLTGIHLQSNQLTGTILSELGQLKALRFLELASNQLGGAISLVLGQLLALESLDISSNAFNGTIPSILGQLSSLTGLTLHSNQLTGTIPSELGQLNALRHLELFSNLLSGTIPSKLGQLINLKILRLFSNQFIGTIPSELGQLTALQHLDLSSNQLSGTLGIINPALITIRLTRNLLSGTIPAELGQLSKLEILLLSHNQLTGEIPSELGQMQALRELDLAINQLSGTIPLVLGQMQSLQIFDLAANLLSGVIPSVLGQLRRMTTLRLHSNQLTGTIPSELGQLTTLQILDLSSNQLSDTIPPALGQLGNLTTLELHSNQLTGSFPSSLTEIASLSNLDVSNNLLTGAIPEGFHRLEQLNLASNRFSGTIPANFPLESSTLIQIDLSDNQLTGTIPVGIFRMQQLSILLLARNQFNGELSGSPSVCSPTGVQLSVIDLSFNQLSGTMEFFRYFAQLTNLNIRHNLFTGEVKFQPEKFFGTPIPGCQIVGVVSVLDQLDVSENYFSRLSVLPPSIKAFSAASCSLSGSVDSLSTLSSAELIDIRNNPKLSGEIPLLIAENPLLLYLFINNTNMRSVEAGPSPGMDLDSSVMQTFGSGESLYECPLLYSKASPAAFLDVNPYYFSYSGCYCGLGFAGPVIEQGVASCVRCRPGYYNDKEDVTSCSPCPYGRYSSGEGSYTCDSCALPFQLAIRDGTDCIDLAFFYLFFFLFIAVAFSVVVTIALIITVLVAVWTGYKLLKWWKSRELRRITLLIQKRARDEIPADLLIRYRDLNMDNVIGAGSFARVYRGYWNRTLVAIKELTGVHSLIATMEADRNGSTSEEDYQNDAGIQRVVNEFKSEVLVMSKLHHPNVLLLVGACSDFPNLCIVTEYLSNGSLYDALHRKHAAEQITLVQQFQWLGETANGMAYLHDQGLMHRDLKSLNVLLDDANRAKLCDFGLARVMGDAHRTMTGGVGSMLWMAPEVMMDAAYDYSADVYAWGILAWEIMSPGVDLFAGKSVVEVSRAVLQGKRPSLQPWWSVGVCEVIVKCWSGVAEERPTFGEVVERLEPLLGVTRDNSPVENVRPVDDLSQPLLS